jgi:hypothetical protein
MSLCRAKKSFTSLKESLQVAKENVKRREKQSLGQDGPLTSSEIERDGSEEE